MGRMIQKDSPKDLQKEHPKAKLKGLKTVELKEMHWDLQMVQQRERHWDLQMVRQREKHWENWKAMQKVQNSWLEYH